MRLRDRRCVVVADLGIIILCSKMISSTKDEFTLALLPSDVIRTIIAVDAGETTDNLRLVNIFDANFFKSLVRKSLNVFIGFELCVKPRFPIVRNKNQTPFQD